MKAGNTSTDRFEIQSRSPLYMNTIRIQGSKNKKGGGDRLLPMVSRTDDNLPKQGTNYSTSGIEKMKTETSDHLSNKSLEMPLKVNSSFLNININKKSHNDNDLLAGLKSAYQKQVEHVQTTTTDKQSKPQSGYDVSIQNLRERLGLEETADEMDEKEGTLN